MKDEDEEDEDADEDGEGSFIALKKNIKENSTLNETREDANDSNLKQMASLAKEYTDEIINNEVFGLYDILMHLLTVVF